MGRAMSMGFFLMTGVITSFAYGCGLVFGLGAT